MPDRDEIGKLTKTLGLIVYPRLGEDFFERKEYEWAWAEYIHEFTPLAEHILANFVPRSEHERIVRELRRKYEQLLERYAEQT